jgi:D-alanine-D-alanine ligase
MKKIKIAILCGGFSSEREISLKTGRAVYDNLSKWPDFNVFLVDIKKEHCIEQLLKLKKQKVDMVFIALHGRFGEDGQLQMLLENIGLKYTGCGVEASMIGMNKYLTKLLLQYNGIPTPEFKILDFTKEEIDINKKELIFIREKKLSFPLVVKPAREGSTIGTSIVADYKSLVSAIKNARKYDNLVLIEKYIKGKEITVPILESETLPLIEIVPKLNKFYDYKSKYQSGGSEHLIPPRIDKISYDKIKETAIKTAKIIGCEILCRVDVIFDENKKVPYVLEVNTIPGMTETSLLPEAAKYKGITFPELVRKIVFASFKKYE